MPIVETLELKDVTGTYYLWINILKDKAGNTKKVIFKIK